MKALKDIGSLSARLKGAPITHSPLWNQPVGSITPVQLFAFAQRESHVGRGAEAYAAIHIVRQEVSAARQAGLLGEVPLLAYEPAIHFELTFGELRKGLEQLSGPAAALALFCLDTGIGPEVAAGLKWDQVLTLPISATAKQIVFNQLRHIRSSYVFWEEQEGQPFPILDLEHRIFAVFEATWGQFAAAFESLVWADPVAESLEIKRVLYEHFNIQL